MTGNSAAARIEAQAYHGAVGDPWAPIHIIENKAFTLGDEGEFDYRKIIELMLSGTWEKPLLATLGPGEGNKTANWVLIAQAFARGNSKTGGFKERIIPLTGRTAKGLAHRHKELHDLAKQQTEEIKKIDVVLRNALALAAAGGDQSKIAEKHYVRSRLTRQRLNAEADRLFFPALWARFEAETAGDLAGLERSRREFVEELVTAAKALLAEAMGDIPCSSIHRPRAEARARRRFSASLRHPVHGFPAYYAPSPVAEESSDAA